MSKTLAISLVISASVNGAFNTAMAGTNRTVERLGKNIDDITGRQARLKEGIKGLPSVFTLQFDSMMNRYRKLGTMIDDLTAKQKRLKDLTKQGAELRAERSEYRSRMGEAVAGSVAVVAPAVQSVRVATSFEDQIKDIAITGNMSRAAEGKLGKAIRENALLTNQTQAELASGTGILVANGMNPEQAKRYSGILGKASTAARGQMDEMAQFMFSLNTSFGIEGEADMKGAIDDAAHAGKQGQFELKHMARYFPELGSAMASFGSKGRSAVRELAMAMQVARKYSGTNEEAATNARNWFAHMTANTTVENFKKVGIDYRGEITKRMQQQKISALQASLQVTDNFVDRVSAGKTITVRKGKKTEQLSFRSALDQARASGDEGAIRSVVERFGLSKVFQDIQTLNFYMAMRQGKDIFKQGMESYNTPAAKGVIDRDFENRMTARSEQLKAFQIKTIELGLAVGSGLLPALSKILAVVTPIVTTVASLAGRFPKLTAAVIGISAGLMLGWVAFLAVGYACKATMAAMVSFRTVVALTQAKLALFRVQMALQNFTGFAGGVRTAALAVKSFSIALLLNPLTWAVVAAVVGLGAAIYQLYKHWNTLKQPGFFKDLRRWIMDETLLGQFFKAGANLVSSFWQGMKSFAMKPVETMKGIVQKIRNHLPFSPAKEGPLRDIHRIKLVETIAANVRSAPLVKAMRAATAAAMAVAMPGVALAQLAYTPSISSVGALARPVSGQGAGMVIHFSPQITVQGGGNSEQIKADVGKATATAFAEFEKFMQRYESQKQRRGF